MRALNRISVQKNVLRSRDVNCNPIPSIDYNHDIYESMGPINRGTIPIRCNRHSSRSIVRSETYSFPNLEGVRETSNGSGMDLYQGYQFNDYSINLPFSIYPILIKLYNCPD